ncbi:MAG TPA: PEP-CTERM sorting domain-containing protein [Fimbriimonadaceae bacterium]|nr:PEP-CTERM sorting domain-containing protein [Fimbriimonadaceae bacterium]
MKTTITLLALAVAFSASAQVVLTGSPYTQDFDSLAQTGTGITWTNNLPTALMPGWYSTAATYDADDGSVPLSGQYSYGSVGSGERALGSTALNGALLMYGMQIQNGSGGTFNSLQISYTGEQWRSGGVSLTDSLVFEYSTNATSLFTGTWTPFSALDFNAPITSGVGALNGNLAANEAFMSATIGSLSWASGTDVWVRWKHIGNSSRDALALDNVQLNATAVPEPASVVGFGVAFLGLLATRRRSRR